MKLLELANISWMSVSFKDELCEFLDSKGYAWAYGDGTINVYKLPEEHKLKLPTDKEIEDMADNYINNIIDNKTSVDGVRENIENIMVEGEEYYCPYCGTKYPKGTNINEFVRSGYNKDDKTIIYCQNCHRALMIDKDIKQL